MGELVLAAKITHVPSIWLSMQPGKHHGIRKSAEDALQEGGRRARERGADTFVIADTHWLNTSGFHVNSRAYHNDTYASHELPHFIPKLRYEYPGNKELAEAIGAAIVDGGQHSLVHDIEDLRLEYGALVPMYIMNSEEPKLRVVPVGCNMFSTIEENLRVGEAIRKAIDASDSKVAFLASGSLSHAFPTNEKTREYLDKISADFNEHMDRHVLELWREGRTQEFLDILPEYNEKCMGEGAMADTGMLFGVLGRSEYHGRGEQLCEYFPSTGTGQVVVDFELPQSTTA